MDAFNMGFLGAMFGVLFSLMFAWAGVVIKKIWDRRHDGPGRPTH